MCPLKFLHELHYVSRAGAWDCSASSPKRKTSSLGHTPVSLESSSAVSKICSKFQPTHTTRPFRICPFDLLAPALTATSIDQNFHQVQAFAIAQQEMEYRVDLFNKSVSFSFYMLFQWWSLVWFDKRAPVFVSFRLNSSNSVLSQKGGQAAVVLPNPHSAAWIPVRLHEATSQQLMLLSPVAMQAGWAVL
jgi:hypothetical protein